MAASASLKSVSFEVFGKVQGVFFRKHTQSMAKKHAVVGWVQNTTRGTVVGTAQGLSENVEKMKHWLSSEGSPRSRIDKCVFKNEKTVSRTEYSSFVIRK